MYPNGRPLEEEEEEEEEDVSELVPEYSATHPRR
jgi:hypothetical protein